MGKAFNILITNVSTAKLEQSPDGSYFLPSDGFYIDVEGFEYTAKITNEAPIKSLYKRLHKKGEQLDCIIYIESDAVRKPLKEGCFENLTSIDFLKNLLKDYVLKEPCCSESCFYPKEIDVEIKDDPTAGDVSKTVFDVYNILVDYARITDHVTNVYIESNGGIRYVLTMLLSITNSLSQSYPNLRIIEITSMVYKGKNNTTPIINTKEIFDTAQITEVISEFMNYGRISSLIKYVDELKKRLDPSTIEEIDKVIRKLSKTSDSIQLCRTSMMLEDFYGLDNLKSVIDRFIKSYQSNANSAVQIFCFLLSFINNELEKSIYLNVNLPVSDLSIHLPKMIKWCLDKNFTQQALTLCSERFPAYLFSSGKIQLSPHAQAVFNSKDSEKYEKHYHFLANYQNVYKRDIFTSKYEKIKYAISNYDVDGQLNLCNVPTSSPTVFSQEHANSIWNLFLEFKALPAADREVRQNMEILFQKYGFPITFLDSKVTVAKSSKDKKKTPVFDVLNGKYLDANGNLKPNTALSTDGKKFSKILDLLVEFNPLAADNTPVFNAIIEDLFPDDSGFSNQLKNRYSEKQSVKYNISIELMEGYISSNVSNDSIQKILYLYAICKEQRNLSNHASVSEDDTPIAMDSKKLSRVITELLNMC